MANQVVYGIVDNRAEAEKVIQTLVDAALNPNDISLLSSQGDEFHDFNKTHATAKDPNRNWRTEERVTDFPAENAQEEHWQATQKNGHQTKSGMGTEKHTKAPEGATAGATTGGIIGGALGLLAGIGALAIPGMGPFIAAGPLMAALSGIGAGGTIGGIIGALAGLGIPEFEAKRYENRLKDGGILLSVRVPNDDVAKKVKDILNKLGVEDVTISSETASSKHYHNKK